MTRSLEETGRPHLSRRQALRISAAATAAAVLAACGAAPTATPVPAKPTTPPAPPAQPTAAAAAPTATKPSAAPTVAPTAPPAAAKQPATIRYHARTGTSADWYAKQAEELIKVNPDIKVTVQLTPDAEYSQKISTDAAAGQLADVIWNGSFYTFPTFSARDLLLDLKPLSDAAGIKLSDFWPVAIESCTWEGKLTGWPHNMHAGYTGMLTNITAFKEAGAPLPKWEWRYDKEWIEAIKAVTLDSNKDGVPERYGFAFNYITQNPYTFIRSWGGDWMDKEVGTKATINSEKSTAALLFFHDLVHKHKVAPPQSSVVTNMFSQKLCSTWQEGMWQVAPHRTLIKDAFQWQLFGMPAGPEGGRGSYAGVGMNNVSKATKYPDASFKWLLWIGRPEEEAARTALGFSPTPLKTTWDAPNIKNDPNFEDAAKWLQFIRPITVPKNSRLTEFNTSFQQGFQAFMLEKANPKGKIDELQKVLQAIADKPAL